AFGLQTFMCRRRRPTMTPIAAAFPAAALEPRACIARPAPTATPAAPAALKTGWADTTAPPRFTMALVAAALFGARLVTAPRTWEATGPTPGINPTAFFASPPRKDKKPGSPR